MSANNLIQIASGIDALACKRAVYMSAHPGKLCNLRFY